jgi:hypothetical protein
VPILGVAGLEVVDHEQMGSDLPVMKSGGRVRRLAAQACPIAETENR